jgi:arylsulfatase
MAIGLQGASISHRRSVIVVIVCLCTCANFLVSLSQSNGFVKVYAMAFLPALSTPNITKLSSSTAGGDTAVNGSLRGEGYTGGNQVNEALREAQSEITTERLEAQGADSKAPEGSMGRGGKDDDIPKPLNVLIFFPDDLRHDSIGSAGTQPVQTPFLDKLAEMGMRFTHNCVTTSICWVSRATLFTGQYLSRHKSDKLFRTTFYTQWNTSWPFLLQQQKDYYVGHIGKWQYRDPGGFVGRAFNWTRIFQFQHWHNIGGKRVHTTDHTRQSTLDFLKDRPKDKPFALTVAFYPPKPVKPKPKPFNPKPESEARYANVTIPDLRNASEAGLPQHIFTSRNAARSHLKATFGELENRQESIREMYRMITEVDEAIGAILEEIKPILHETMVIFTSDNGLLHGEHGLGGKCT